MPSSFYSVLNAIVDSSRLNSNLFNSSTNFVYPNYINSFKSTLALVERERRYIVLKKIAENWLEKQQFISCTEIIQSYFPDTIFELLFSKISTQFILPAGIDEAKKLFKVTQARLRRELDDCGETCYSIAVKGRVPNNRATERIELPIELSEDGYNMLKPYADRGTVVKKRLKVLSEVNKKLFTIELDYPMLRTTDNESETLANSGLIFIEIEANTRLFDRDLKLGRHSVKLLENSIDISKDIKSSELNKIGKLKKHFSWSKIATNGLNPKAVKLAHKLLTKF